MVIVLSDGFATEKCSNNDIFGCGTLPYEMVTKSSCALVYVSWCGTAIATGL